jgi:hypothetical protein
MTNSVIKKRRTQSFLIFIFVVLEVIDVTPEFNKPIVWLRKQIDPILDLSGLWQGPWSLFAPDTDKINTRVSAEVLFSDGSISYWNSPEWVGMSATQRFLRFREAEYYDSIRNDSNSAGWPSFADWVIRNVVLGKENRFPVEITLFRHWNVIDPPSLTNFIPYGTFQPMSSKYAFYKKSYEK